MTITSLCPWRMQVHHLQQESTDTWTISLINHDFYRWQAGQFALVQIGSSGQLRAYTLSSTPGQSEFITLTIRHIEGGAGSSWLTRAIHPGDTVWLSDPQGSFTCENHPSDRYLFLAAGCGITPMMSMCRWLKANQPACNVQLFYSVRTRDAVIFAQELAAMTPWLDLRILMEDTPAADLPEGRITQEYVQKHVPDIADRTVMICGPQGYMDQVKGYAASLGAEKIYLENFIPVASQRPDEQAETFRIRSEQRAGEAEFREGETLLEAMETNQIAVETACRTGVCGCCKTQVLSGRYTTQSQQTLSEAEQQAGFVLACSCYPASDIVIA